MSLAPDIASLIRATRYAGYACYGSLKGGIATIIHAKVQFDNNAPFCAPAEGSGDLGIPPKPNDDECIPSSQAPYMWIIDPAASQKLSVDVKAIAASRTKAK